MGTVSDFEAAYQRKAMSESIKAARDLIGNGLAIPSGTPVGMLSDVEFGWLVTSIIFAWISTRAEQAAREGLERIERAGRNFEMM